MARMTKPKQPAPRPVVMDLPPAARPAPLTPAQLRAEEPQVWDIALAEMVPLGQARGHAWYSAPARLAQLAGYEYEVLDDQVVLADWVDTRGAGVWVVGADGEAYVATRQWPAGTCERFAATAARAARPASYSPADMLAEHWRFLKWRGTPTAEALVAHAGRAGVLVGLDAGRTRTVRWYRDGVPLATGHPLANVLDMAEPLVVAHLAGVPADCAIEGCRPEPHPAATMAGLGVPWCGQRPELEPPAPPAPAPRAQPATVALSRPKPAAPAPAPAGARVW
jgi:hypothetical protein